MLTAWEEVATPASCSQHRYTRTFLRAVEEPSPRSTPEAERRADLCDPHHARYNGAEES